jgi:4-hydroxy-3-methylbut-2-enyl diphosphate reductase IspH
MNVLRAEALGLCFGVRDALAVARETVNPHDVTIHGELVHNERVLVQLEARGFAMSSERDRAALPATSHVMITAHGVSDRERATRDRQEAVEKLCRQVDALIVVGGARSNNTKQLVALCERLGRRAFHVQSADDLDPSWFAGCATIGLTAGTSTLDETVDAVETRLRRL